MNVAYRVKPRPLLRSVKPVRSEAYKAFIRKQASPVSGLGPCDACHTGGHGRGQKSSDLECIPLTRKEHDQFDKDPQGFAALHGLDIPELILKYQKQYQEEDLNGVPASKPVGREEAKR
jgi:hypothetical protein